MVTVVRQREIFSLIPLSLPADQLRVLRITNRKALESPKLRAEANKAKRTINPGYGQNAALRVMTELIREDYHDSA